MQAKKLFPKIGKIVLLLCLLANIIMIFYFSSKDGTASNTISLQTLQRLTDRLGFLPGLEHISNVVIRKSAHFIEYFALGFLLTCTIKTFLPNKDRWCVLPLLTGLLIACADELFQTFVPGRTGAIQDVALDFAGICFGALLACILILLLKGLHKVSCNKI